MSDVQLALTLMDRYDALHWDIVALREFGEQPASKQVCVEGSAIDQARFRVSQFFGHLKTLVEGGFVSQEFVNKVISADAARLSEALVEPLNKIIRARKHLSTAKAATAAKTGKATKATKATHTAP